MSAGTYTERLIRYLDRMERYDASLAFNQKALLFLIVHLPLAYAIKVSWVVATAHALAVFAYGLSVATRRNGAEKLAYVLAYIAGAELLWRLGHAKVFWEFGKYSAAALILVYFFAHGLPKRLSILPMIYFALLIPSCFVVWDRKLISFNISGPFALALATLFFSQLHLARPQLRRVILAVLAPAVGLAFVATYMTATTRISLAFGGAVSKRTSAGIGPNQMSSILGLAAFLLFLYLFTQRGNRPVKAVSIALIFWLTGQAAMTYSRGGVWTAALAAAVAAFFLLRNRRARAALVLSCLVLLPLTRYVLIPALDRYSDGTLVLRFTSLDTTGRDERALADLEAFRQNPVFGVGLGQPRPGDFDMTAHTELTRLPAEHGIFGIAAFLVLCWIGARRLRGQPDLFATALAASLTAWSLLFMLHAAMRLFAPSFAFGLASAMLIVHPLASRRRSLPRPRARSAGPATGRAREIHGAAQTPLPSRVRGA